MGLNAHARLRKAIGEKTARRGRDRTGLRRTAADPRLRQGRLPDPGLRRGSGARSNVSGRGELHRAYPLGLDCREHRPEEVRADGRHAPAWRGRRPADLRAHAAEREPRSRLDVRRGDGPRRSPPCCGPANWSSWRAPPIPAPRATWCCRSWPPSGLEGGKGFLPGLQSRAGGPGQSGLHGRRTFPRSSAASSRPAASWPNCSTARRWPAWCRSPVAKWPRPARSWRTPTARSTSPWSTS